MEDENETHHSTANIHVLSITRGSQLNETIICRPVSSLET